MAQQYKVRYNDGRVQTITADSWASAGANWAFSLDGKDIALIAQKSVESISNADVPDPEVPQVEVAEFRRAPRTGAV